MQPNIPSQLCTSIPFAWQVPGNKIMWLSVKEPKIKPIAILTENSNEKEMENSPKEKSFDSN